MPSLSSITIVLVSCVIAGALLTRTIKLLAVWWGGRGKKTKKRKDKHGACDRNASAVTNKGSSSAPKRLISPYSKHPVNKKVVEVESVSQVFDGKNRQR